MSVTLDGIAQGIDERMNLGGQSAARSADRLRAVFSRAGSVLTALHSAIRYAAQMVTWRTLPNSANLRNAKWSTSRSRLSSSSSRSSAHERAKGELKALMPEDAREAIGHGVRGRRSKSGAVSFDVLTTEAVHAPVQ
jgi:hypothetical protein